MKQKAVSKRMSSIAARINRSQVFRLFWTLMLVSVLVVAATLLGWAYAMEKQALGDQWQLQLQRSLQWLKGAEGMDLVRSVQYMFSLPEGEVHNIAAGGFLEIVSIQGKILLGAQAVILFLSWRTGRRHTMRLLSPLHQMSDAAEQLSRIKFDEQKYHDLEDAIEKISPTAPDARLSTGDSDLKGLETAVNNLVTRMHDSYRQQNRFVSDASHELRTPISVIQGYAQMLDRWGKDDEKILGESITAIRTEADNMQQLVEQLLFLARGDAGRQQPKLKPLDLSRLMREVYEEYEMIDKDHVWRLQADQVVPAVGDPAQLKQAARVLCDNAAKYSSPGQPITLRSFVDEKGVPCFSVQDAGQGIAAQDLPHVFERFYRSDPARARNTGGAGLGLSIAKWIVDQHQGYFQVVTREGLGSRIVVCLPVKSMSGKEAPTEDVHTNQPAQAAK